MRVLSALCVAVCCGLGTAHAQPCAEAGSVTDWSQRYLQLRSVSGHFSGGAWDPAVDAWGGDKHRLMQCLAAHAVAAPARALQLQRLMGSPDEVLRCPSPACADIASKAEWGHAAPPSSRGELWLYHWRGRHDRLVLAMARGTVRADGWLYARE